MQAKLLLPLFVLLAGCADYTTSWTPEDSPKQLHVDVSHQSYEVRFASGTASLAPAETTRLARFVAGGGIQPADRIVIEQSDPIGKLAEQRRNALLKALRRNGVGASVAVAKAPKPRADRVVLEIEHGIATPPACPDWSKPPIDYSAQVASNFGCATATNLANMVADPNDLLHGNPSDRASGVMAGGAVQAYRDHQGFGTPGAPSPYATDSGGAQTTSQ